MSNDANGSGRLGFLDALARIFRSDEAAPSEPPDGLGRLEALDTKFESAVGSVLERIEALKPAEQRIAESRRGLSDEDLELAHEQDRRDRLAAVHGRILADVVAMHARLGTGLSEDQLREVATELHALDETVEAGQGSLEFLPRARHAVGERLRAEAGELAVERLRVLIERAEIVWPDPTRYEPQATEEEIERSRRRRLAETREAFLAQGLGQIAHRTLGVITGWGADYPSEGSALWEETVLLSVAAGLRGYLVKEFADVLASEREAVASAIEGLVGKEIAELHDLVRSGVRSIADANLAVAGAVQAIDTVAPDVVWELVVAQHPKAGGDWGD